MPFTQTQVREAFKAWTDNPNAPVGLRAALASILLKLDCEEAEWAVYRKKFLAAARELYQGEELVFDDDAALSDSEDGQWVEGWRWISNAEAKVEAMLLDPEVHCCHLLYGEGGFVAKCSIEKAVEHDHDRSAEDAWLADEAVKVYDLQEELNVSNGLH